MLYGAHVQISENENRSEEIFQFDKGVSNPHGYKYLTCENVRILVQATYWMPKQERSPNLGVVTANHQETHEREDRRSAMDSTICMNTSDAVFRLNGRAWN